MPFCPKCRDEWQDWVKACPDCHVELVDKLPAEPNKKPDKYENIVTVTTFAHPEEAYLALTKLRSEGIMCFVADDYAATMNSLYSYIMGGVKICAWKCDVEEARRILGLSGPDILPVIDKKGQEISKDKKCPGCGSWDISHKKFDEFALFTALMAIGGIMSLFSGDGFTLPFAKRKWICKSCGYEWRMDK